MPLTVVTRDSRRRTELSQSYGKTRGAVTGDGGIAELAGQRCVGEKTGPRLRSPVSTPATTMSSTPMRGISIRASASPFSKLGRFWSSTGTTASGRGRRRGAAGRRRRRRESDRIRLGGGLADDGLAGAAAGVERGASSGSVWASSSSNSSSSPRWAAAVSMPVPLQLLPTKQNISRPTAIRALPGFPDVPAPVVGRGERSGLRILQRFTSSSGAAVGASPNRTVSSRPGQRPCAWRARRDLGVVAASGVPASPGDVSVADIDQRPLWSESERTSALHAQF